jgi:hypothetical protein
MNPFQLRALTLLLALATWTAGCGASVEEETEASTESNLGSAPKPLSYWMTFRASPWAPGVCQDDGYHGILTCDQALDPQAESWMEKLENAKDLECIGPYADFSNKTVKPTTCGWDCTSKYEIKCCPKATPARWGRFGDNAWDNAYCKQD